MKKDLIVIFLLLLISIPAVKSLFIPGGYTSHDLTHHIIRQISMDKLLSEGQFPPRWSGELNEGFGYPLFLFNYPLPALLGEVFYKAGFGFVDSVKAVLFLSMIISVLGMYLFLKEFLGVRLAAFLGAVFYLYAPIRFLNVYVSAAVGSALALGIVPVVFLSLVKIKKGSKWAQLMGVLSFAALILSHNVTALIFAPFILSFAGLLIWQSKDRIRVIREIGVMGGLGLGLSAWFWLPAFFEKQYIIFDQIYSNFYKDQFVTMIQLLHSSWGYGLSHPQKPEPGDMSYQLGLIQIGVVVLLTLLILGSKKIRGIREIREIGGFSLAIFLISLILMLRLSLPLWENLPFLSLVQFPWRFSAISLFCASIVAALLVKWIPAYAGMTIRWSVFIVLLILVIYANRNHWNINEKFDPGENYYLSLKTTSTSYGEHLPPWGKIMDKPSLGKLEFIRGVGQIRVIKDKSDGILAEVQASKSASLRLNQIYFPGWEIKVDGQRINFDYLNGGLPIFNITDGSHIIEAEFKNTPIRNTADRISIISMIVFVILLCKLLLQRIFPVKR